MADKNISRVTLNGAPLIDIHEDSVTPETLKKNETAHNRSGTSIVGNYEGGDVSDCYKITDPESTGLADDDYIPFNDVSDAETPKKKTLFSTIVDKLKDTFLTKTGFKPEGIGSGFCIGTVSGSAITATLEDFVLTKGGIIVLSLGEVMPENATLNINNTGAKTIYWQSTAIRAHDIPKIAAGIWTLFYDGSQYRIISFNIAPIIDTADNQIRLKAGVNQNEFQIQYDYDARKLFWNGFTNNAWIGRKRLAEYDEVFAALNYYNSLEITNGDLNNYTTPGLYFWSEGNYPNITNTPPLSDSYMMWSLYTSGSTWKRQIAMRRGVPDQIWTRIYSNSSTSWSKWNYIGSSLNNGIGIPENADLNTYTTEGTYFIQYTGTAQTISNIPLPYAGKLIVMKVRGSNNLIQRYYTYDLNIWYQRSTDNSGSTWTDWAYMSSHTGYGTNIPSDSDLNNYKNPGVYNIVSNAVAATISNIPVPYAGKLIVLNIASNIYREQQFIPLNPNNGIMYQRFWDNNGSVNTWSAWKKIATIDNVIESNKGLSSSAISSLDDIPVNTAGRIKLAAAISPLGSEADYVYICYGTSVSKTVELSRMVKANSDLFWKNTTNTSDGWTGWQPLSRTGTYIGTCNTAADQQVKVATVDNDFRLVKGVRVGIYYSNTNTYNASTSAPCKLNVNQTGDKNIYYAGTSTPTGTNFNAFGYGSRYTYYVYNGSFWVYDGHSFDDNTTYSLIDASQIQAGTDTASRVVRADYLKSGIRRLMGCLDAVEVFIPDNSGYPKYLIFQDVTTWYNSTTTGQTTYLFTGFAITERHGGSMNNFSAQVTLGVSWQKVSSPDSGNLNLSTTSTRYLPAIISDGSKYYLALRITNSGRPMTLIGRWYNIDPLDLTANDRWVLCTDTSGTMPSGWTVPIPWGNKAFKFSLLSDGFDTRALGIGYGTCNTAASTAAKVATLSQYVLKNGGYVTIKFDYDVPANATLNINTEGAKAIYYRGSAITAGVIKAGDRATFVYNGSQYDLVALDRNIIGQTFIGTCTTAADQQKKIATVDSSFVLQKGVRIGIKYSYTNTYSSTTSAPVTLNVNNTGDKNLYYNQTNGASSNTGTNATVYGVENRYIYYIYDGSQWIWDGHGVDNNSDHYTTAWSETAAGTAAKVATCTNFALLAKSHIMVLIRYANSYNGAITLNINGTGAKPIYINGSASSSSNKTLPAGSYLVYFNGTNYYFRTDGKITCAGTVTV